MQPEISRPEVIPPVVATPKQNTGLWGGWSTVGLGVAIFAIYFIAQTVVSFIFVFDQLITNSGLPDPQSILNLATNGDLIAIATIVSAVFGTGFIILFIKIRKGANLRNYLGLKTISKKTLLILLAVVIGLVILSGILSQVLRLPEDTGFTVNAYKTTTWPALLWITLKLV